MLRNRRWWISGRRAVAIVFVFVLGAFSFAPRLIGGGQWMLVRGESVAVKLALISPWLAESEIKEGAYVVLRWVGEDPQGQGLEDGMSLVKKVGCLPGHDLRVTKDGAWCDGRYLMSVPDRNSRGLPVAAALFDGQIPSGRVFLIGDIPKSYDSRFWGVVPITQLTHIVRFAF